MKTRRGALSELKRSESVESKHSEESSMQGEFGLEATDENQHHIMQLLTNMYSDPYKATVLEALSNAYDAHKRAGNTTDAIEIFITDTDGVKLASKEIRELLKAHSNRGRRSTQTLLSGRKVNPSDIFSLVVQDYGTGMSIEDLRNKFFLYGASDKRRNPNKADEAQEERAKTERGGFGLGCKAGLAIMGVVIVRTVKDGVLSSAVGYLNEDINKIDYSEPVETSEPNGTRISVPFTAEQLEYIDAGIFSEKTLMFWDSSIPLDIYGERWDPAQQKIVTNVSKWETATCLSGTVRYSPVLQRTRKFDRMDNHSIFVNLGNVAYTVDLNNSDIHKTLKKLGFESFLSYSFSIDVPLTSVISLTPSRESILYDAETVSNLCGMIKEAVKAIDGSVISRINQCETAQEASLKLYKLSKVISKTSGRVYRSSGDKFEEIFKLVSGIKWRGQPIFEKIPTDHIVNVAPMRTIKSTAFKLNEKWVEENKTLNHRVLSMIDMKSMGFNHILVSVPEGTLDKPEEVKKVSLACRAIAGNLKMSKFYTLPSSNASESFFIHFSHMTVEELKADPYISSSYSSIAGLDELLEESKRIKEALKATVQPAAGNSSSRGGGSGAANSYAVMKASERDKLAFVSQDFLADKEVIILSCQTLSNDVVDKLSQYAKDPSVVDSSDNTFMKNVHKAYMGSLEEKVSAYAKLFPDAYFLLLPSARRSGPVYKALPQAKHLWVRLFDILDRADLPKFEETLIASRWDKMVKNIATIAEAYNYGRAAEIVAPLIQAQEDAFGDERKNIAAQCLYMSVAENYDSNKISMYLREEEISKTRFSSVNFESKLNPSSDIDMLELINLIYKNEGMKTKWGFKFTSTYSFFEVISFVYRGKNIPSQNSTESLAVSLINKL